MKIKRTIITAYCALLAAFSIYLLLDTFVIERVYSAEGSAYEQTGSVSQAADATEQDSTGPQTVNAALAETTVTKDTYQDENISIKITEYRTNDTTVYAADIQLSSAGYLKTALAKGMYGRNVTARTSVTAAENDAILAINGDYYGSQQKGYVIRNGVLYRSTAVKGNRDLVIYEDGSFGIISEEDTSAEQLLADGAVQVLSFGPAIVEDGEVTVSSSYEVGKAMASNPRTAIGIIDDLHYVFVVSDGRTSESEGLSVRELAEFMKSLGVKTAYNLDGGGSSTMWFNGSIVNKPTSNGRTISERSVSDIVYIGY